MDAAFHQEDKAMRSRPNLLGVVPFLLLAACAYRGMVPPPPPPISEMYLDAPAPPTPCDRLTIFGFAGLRAAPDGGGYLDLWVCLPAPERSPSGEQATFPERRISSWCNARSLLSVEDMLQIFSADTSGMVSAKIPVSNAASGFDWNARFPWIKMRGENVGVVTLLFRTDTPLNDSEYFVRLLPLGAGDTYVYLPDNIVRGEIVPVMSSGGGPHGHTAP
jgi:hypothetical protein